MKKLVILLIIPLMLLCSCRESEQIDELAFVKILGIDIINEKLTVTCGMILPESKEGEVKNESISVECDTLSQGLNLIEASTDRKVFFGQIENVVFGCAAAQSGIMDNVDYLVRSDELRFDIDVTVFKDGYAKTLIEESNDDDTNISQRITKLLKSGYSTSVSGEIQLATLVEMLEDPFRSPYLPYIEKDGDALNINGYCIFEKDKLISFFSPELSLGINFLNGDVKNRAIIATIDDKKITLKLTKIKTNIKLNNGVYMVNINFMSEVLQAESTVQNFDQAFSARLVEYQNTEIKKTVTDTVDKLQQLGCDVSVFGDTFHNNAPKKAEEYMHKWNKAFSGISIEVNVTSSLDPSKISGKPVKQGE